MRIITSLILTFFYFNSLAQVEYVHPTESGDIDCILLTKEGYDKLLNSAGDDYFKDVSDVLYEGRFPFVTVDQKGNLALRVKDNSRYLTLNARIINIPQNLPKNDKEDFEILVRGKDGFMQTLTLNDLKKMLE